MNGVYGVKREYNAYANLERETWLDAYGHPTENEEGYAIKLYDYDLSNSDTVECYYETYLNAAGVPTKARNGAWGMTMLYYPATLVHTISYIDENGEPIVSTKGYAILEYEEDEFGNCVWEGYYDAVHAQINCVDGYASVERSYDEYGRLIAERYLDRYNKLTNNAEGFAGWNGYYEDDQLVITNRYDQDRNSLPLDEE